LNHLAGSTRVLALVADLLFAARIRGTADAAGVTARTFASAAALEEAARAGAPALVLVDLGARGADPAALIARLRAEPATARVPVIAFAAHVEREAIAAARRAGADRVLARSAFVRELPDLLAALRGG
jgi:CheY-like chemotaxis protein